MDSGLEPAPGDRPKLSVVIGAYAPGKNARDCIAPIVTQDRDAEILLVHQSPDDPASWASQPSPPVKKLHFPELALMPELWEQGIQESQGEIVALLSADCIPAPGWVEGILRAHKRGFSGVGGAIECDASSSLAGWAVYFCRYSRYMPPFAEHETDDFAADNASYQRKDIDQCMAARANGFWEPEIHAELARTGQKLSLDPGIIVHFRNSMGILEFVQQRFHHGMQYGRDRGAGLPPMKRLFYIARSPLIPLVLLKRIASRVIKRRRNMGRFICSLPLVSLFLLGWTLGEVSGYLSRKGGKTGNG